jgi:hypothetical protein
VAQNLRAADGRVTNMSFGDARGRSFHDAPRAGQRRSRLANEESFGEPDRVAWSG